MIAATQLLTPRNVQVLQLVADGLSNKDIAAQLSLSPRTVKQHLRYCRLRLQFAGGPVNRIQLANRLGSPMGTFHSPEHVRLTPREEQLLQGIVAGMQYKEIAAQWGVSTGAVKSGAANRLFDKIGMSSKAEAAAWYRAHCVSQ